jgi:hypothetical protein
VRTASRQAREFLFGAGLGLPEPDRRVLGVQLTRARRRFKPLAVGGVEAG